MSYLRGTCIWCWGDARDAPPEHVVPEALGCPPEWILEEGACSACNHGPLATLDGVLAHSFDVLRVKAGMKGKRGRPATIAGRGNMKGTSNDGNTTLAINMGPTPVDDATFGRLSPPRGKTTDARATMQGTGQPGGPGLINVKVEFDGRDVVRGLHKVALGLLAVASDFDVTTSALDAVREFVVHDRGSRYVLAGSGSVGEYRHEMLGVRRQRDDDACTLALLLCGAHFLVDLSPTQPTIACWRADPSILAGVGILPSSARDRARHGPVASGPRS